MMRGLMYIIYIGLEVHHYPFLSNKERLLAMSAVVSAEEVDCGMGDGAGVSDAVSEGGRGNCVFSLPSIGSCTEGEVRGMIVL